MEYVLYNPISKRYLEDEETLEVSRDLQRAMVISGEELADSLVVHFPLYEKKLIQRPKIHEPAYIALMEATN